MQTHSSRFSVISGRGQKLLLLSALVLTLTACASNKRAPAPDQAIEGQQVDMTRPPNTIGKRVEEVEGNPEETVSFEQWNESGTAPDDDDADEAPQTETGADE